MTILRMVIIKGVELYWGEAQQTMGLTKSNESILQLPPISLRQMQIKADRRNGDFLDVKLELKSIEYTP